MNLPAQPSGIYHPMIKEIYIKSNLDIHNQNEKILVIKAHKGSKDLMGLLADLQQIQQNAEKQYGQIDHVDLTVH